MWGQGKFDNLNLESAGIIPTRVGTSGKFFILLLILQDHPHACGDK